MVSRPKTAAPAPPSADVFDDSPSEHIFIGGDDFATPPAEAARTVASTVRLNNPMRHVGTEFTFYEEGVVKVTHYRRGKSGEPFLIDMRFLDPVPRIVRVIAKRWLKATLSCTGVAALAAVLLRFEVLYPFALAVVGLAGLAAIACLYMSVYSSYESTEFYTSHGRARVLRLVANLGSMKKYRALVPTLSRAIDEAVERIGEDTAAYLRAEMREHYRLRGDGVLSNEICAAGTGRILAQFDVRI